MGVIVDQPKSIATARRPPWEMVMSYVEQFRHDTSYVALGVEADVVMRERDVLDRSRYGTPLTSGNDRDHLVQAYQECLSACVSFMNELSEHGVIATTDLSKEVFPDRAKRWYLHDVQQLFVSQVRVSISLRAVIEERGHLGQTSRKEAT